MFINDLSIYEHSISTLKQRSICVEYSAVFTPDFKIEEFKLFLEEHLEDIPVENCIEKIICFGPNQIGPNILINNIPRFVVLFPSTDCNTDLI